MYSLRASWGGMYGGNPGAYFSQDNYGRIAEGNLRNSYGPWIDPELQRVPHRVAMRRSHFNRHRGRRRHSLQY